MASPTTNNTTAGIVNQILKILIEGAGQASIEAALIAQYPFLAWPFVRQIMELILSYALGIIYTNAANAATAVIIDIQVNVEASAASAAFQNLQMAIASGDQSAITKASQDLDNAYSSLIHTNGSSPA